MIDINLIVANGCSFTAGGGLENPHEDSFFKDYLGNPKEIIDKKKMNYGRVNAFDTYQSSGAPYWKHENEVAFPAVLSKLLKINSINLAEQGASLKRVIRTTYKFIHHYQGDLSKVLFIIEVPPGIRTEIFSRNANRFIHINTSVHGIPKKEGNDKISFLKNIVSPNYKKKHIYDIYASFAVKYYFDDELANREENLNSRNEFITKYFFEYFDISEHFFEEWYLLESLLSFFEQNKINCFLTEHKYFEKDLKNYHSKYLFIKEIEHIQDFSLNKKMTINDRFYNIGDLHPSLECHEVYANLLKEKIEKLFSI